MDISTFQGIDQPIPIFSLFFSMDGEVNVHGPGCPSTFIRLAGCNLRCTYCDSRATQDPDTGLMTSVKQILAQAQAIGCPKVTLTGGEPFCLVKDGVPIVRPLLLALAERGFSVSVETNGTAKVEDLVLHPNISYVVDYKPKSSGMNHAMPQTVEELVRWNNYAALSRATFKFPVLTNADFRDALRVIMILRECTSPASGAYPPLFAMSPINGQLDSPTASTILEMLRQAGEFKVIVNTQLHKLLGLSEDSPDKKPASMKNM